jgi:uncharacterized RDD family membrane protein YckC
VTSGQTQAAIIEATAAEPARAGLLRRWAALVYEAFLLVAILMVAGFAVLPLVSPTTPDATHTADQLYLLPPLSRAFVFFYYFSVIGAYFLGFWSNGRRTLAMKTWNLRLVQNDGSPLDVRLAAKRYCGAWIGPAAGLAGYALAGGWGLLLGLVNYSWAWLDTDRQFLHDRIAGTRLVRG